MAAKDIAVGVFHTCAILDNDQLKCWGLNGRGQLGYDDAIDRGDALNPMSSFETVAFAGNPKVLKIFANNQNTCAFLGDEILTSSLKCWGNNSFGQLGLDHTNSLGAQLGDMENLESIFSLNGSISTYPPSFSINSIGSVHACFSYHGALKCWGGNNNGQLGYGDFQSRGRDGRSIEEDEKNLYSP